MATDPPPPQSRRRWFRVSLRALMVLVLIVGGGLGWMTYRIRTQRAAIAAVRAVGGRLTFDYQAEPITPGPPAVYRTEPAAPRWLRWVLGDELFQSVTAVELSGGGLDQPGVDPTEILALVARFDRLEVLLIWHESSYDLGYGHLRELPRLRSMSLNGQGITDASLAGVAQVPGLRSLMVNRAAVTDAGFARLAAAANLDHLILTGESPLLTDGGVARALAGMPRLRTLQLMDPARPVAASLAELGRSHRDLETLWLNDQNLKATDLAPLGKLAQLRTLHLSMMPVDDAGLAHLRPLGNLTLLSLNHTQVSDAGLVHLAGLTRLADLSLVDAHVTNAGVAHLVGLTHLRTLNLGGTQINDAGVALLRNLPRLADLALYVNRGQITDAALAGPGFAALEALDLRQTGITAEGLGAIQAAHPRVKIQADAPTSPPPGVAPGPGSR